MKGVHGSLHAVPPQTESYDLSYTFLLQSMHADNAQSQALGAQAARSTRCGTNTGATSKLSKLLTEAS